MKAGMSCVLSKLLRPKASEGTSKQNKNPATPEIAGQNRVKYEIGYETGYETGMKPFGYPRLENSAKVWAHVLARNSRSNNNNNGSRGNRNKVIVVGSTSNNINKNSNSNTGASSSDSVIIGCKGYRY